MPSPEASPEPSRGHDADEAAWRWEEDREDVSWRQAEVAAQPVPTPVPPPVTGSRLAEIRSLGPWAVALYALLAASAILAVVRVVAHLERLAIARELADGDYSVTEGEVRRADDFVLTSGRVSGILVLVTCVVFIVWFYRARRNVELFGLHAPSLRWGWAIGGWFCPVVNLWFPAYIAHDIWKGSDASRGTRDAIGFVGRTTVVTCWWVAFTGATVLGRLSTTLFPGVDQATLDDFVTADRLGAAAGVLMAIAGPCAIALVWRITGFQKERTAQLTAMSGPRSAWGASHAGGLA